LVEAADEQAVPVAVWTDAERRRIAHRVMRDYPAVEQTGFVIPGIPEAEGETGRLWRLEMAGGEFCGNAARSFGLWVARKQGLCGKVAISITLSGAKDPLTVLADTENGEAEVALPPPRKTAAIRYRGEYLPAVIFDGITHVIIEGIDQNTDKTALAKTFFAVKEAAYNALAGDSADAQSFAAFGALFYDTATAFLRPAVFVSGIESFVFENSCGSGSAAFACHRARHLPDGEHRLALHQPGGTITTRVVKKTGRPAAIFIGGHVAI
jgi:diaminopimelate epimerase